MTTSDYISLAIYRDREREMMRKLERRRVQTERQESSTARPQAQSGILSAFGSRFNRLQNAVQHQTARG